MTLHTHDEVTAQKNLPRVGQTVRSKKYGTLWTTILEKREVWQNVPADLQTDQAHLVPAIYLSFLENPGSHAGFVHG